MASTVTHKLKTSASLLVYTPEGAAITTRDLIQFESTKIARRTFEISLPNVGANELGLLPPAGADATANTGLLRKVYSGD
jgi:hypothetical protein